MQTQTVERFKNHGVKIDPKNTDAESLATQLGAMEVDALLDIVEEFSGDNTINVPGDSQTQTLALSYALVNAFENDLDQIGQAEIDTAVEKAMNTVNSITNPPKAAKAKKSDALKGRIAERRTLVNRLVKENPDALADEIIDLAQAEHPAISTNTTKVYYYQERKALGLDPVGKRGRKKTDTMDKVVAILDDNLDKPKAEMVQKLVDALPITEGTAKSYYSKAKKQLKQNA